MPHGTGQKQNNKKPQHHTETSKQKPERGPKLPSRPREARPAAVRRMLRRLGAAGSLRTLPPPRRPASGVQVADEVCLIFYDSRVRKCSPPEEVKKRKKAVLFCLSADKKCIIVEGGKEISVGDVGVTMTDPFSILWGCVPKKIGAMPCMMQALKQRNPEKRS